MGRRWRCVNGHSDRGQLALPACPVCGLPVTVEQDLPAVASRAAVLAAPPAAGDDTMVGQLPSGQAPAARPDAGRGEGAAEDRIHQTLSFPPPEPASDNGNGSPSSHHPQDPQRPAVVNWLPLVSPAGHGLGTEHPTLMPPPSAPPEQALPQGGPST